MENLETFYNWFVRKDEHEVALMSAHKSFQVKGAGFLWVLPISILWIGALKITIESYDVLNQEYEMWTIILGLIVAGLLGVLFMGNEIKRIKLLNEYDKHAVEYLKTQKDKLIRESNDIVSLVNGLYGICRESCESKNWDKLNTITVTHHNTIKDL